ncbi:hypothetical protein C8J56DRAFT_227716 [Mycena floridula]|nr:hypothetical protein C8J56DRAFT_227716 [Mycena floridula]
MSIQVLFEPLTLGLLTLKNRVLMSALTRSRSVPKTTPNALNEEYYKQRAGAGLIVNEATLVCPQGSEWTHAPGIFNQEQVVGWKKITNTVHREGSLIFCQLWHLGRISHPDMPEQIAAGEPVYAPSAISAKGGKFRLLPGSSGYVTPTAMEDPQLIIDRFKQAAINAKEAGFDGIEIHGANGYLPNQFLDSNSNQRSDRWGGSVENRARFCLEVVKVVSDVWSPDRVSLKLSPCGGYNDMGMPLAETIETYSYLISEINKLDIAYLVLARYSEDFDPTGRGTPHDVVATYRHLISNPKTRFFVNGGFTPEEAAQYVSEGKADGVFFGLLYINTPDLAQRIQHGKPLDNPMDYATLYGHEGTEESNAKGYTDYPATVY